MAPIESSTEQGSFDSALVFEKQLPATRRTLAIVKAYDEKRRGGSLGRLGLLSSLVLVCACAPPDDEHPGSTRYGLGSSGTNSGPTSTGGNGDATFTTPEFNLDGSPIYSRAVPLTNVQWARSVKNVLSLENEPTQANSFLEPVGGFTVFTNNERVLEVSNNLRESYQYAAAELAEDLMSEAGAVAQVGAGMSPDAFIETVGRRAFRRPLSSEELAAYRGLYDIGVTLTGEQSDFVKGASLVVEGLLQSPHFLYRTELQPDGAPLTGFEIASKLSLWLLGTSPSDELLDQAEQGELDTPAGVATVVDEMLAEPAASETAVEIYAELLAFSRYRDVIKEDAAFSPTMNAEMETVARLLFQHIYEEDLGLLDILTSTEGYVGPELAALYGITPAPTEPTLMDLGSARPGYFTQVPYLMLYGDGSNSDAIHRGIFLNYEVLCAKLPVPEFQVPQLKAPKPNQSSRQRVEAHTGFGTCGESCHGGYINPLGYAFENFDGLGRDRDTDNGQPIDTASAYPLADDVMTPFSGAPELMQLLSSSDMAHACFVKNLMSYGMQRDIVETDQALIDRLTAISLDQAASIKQIMRELAVSEEFRTHLGAPQ